MRTRCLNWIIVLLIVVLVLFVIAIGALLLAMRERKLAESEEWRDVAGFSLPVERDTPLPIPAKN